MDPADDAAPGAAPGGYPAAFETDVVLADGATAHVRPIRPDDGPRLIGLPRAPVAARASTSGTSARDPGSSERDLERLTHVDYVDRFALVALRGDELIGVARYDRWRHRAEAEVAFFVDDANHGRGLATVLLEHLAVRGAGGGAHAGSPRRCCPRTGKMIGVFTAGGLRDGHPLRRRRRRGAARPRSPRPRPRRPSRRGPARPPPRRCGACCRPAASR